MEKQSLGSVPPGAAQEQLRAARQAHEASVRRAMPPAGFVLALSVFCGAQTVAPAYKGPGNVVTIIAVVWFLAELLKMSARNQWRPLRSLPKPRWGVTEATLISVAVLVGGVIGPHLLASHSDSALASWGLGAAVTAIVAACLFAAMTSFRRRASRAWQR
jgi:Mn2+/Fe2+ NRAMP family transporter